jgi:hypothetical protein
MLNAATIRARMGRYARTVSWLVGDALRADAMRIVQVFGLNAAGIALAAGSMALVLRYVQWAQKPHPLGLFGVSIADRPSIGLTGAVALLSLILGLGSAILIYTADRSLLEALRATQRRIMGRLLVAYGQPSVGVAMLEFERRLGEAPSPMDMMNAGGRYAAFALRSILQLFLPGMTLLVALASLVWIDAAMTLGLAALAVTYLVPLYLINRSVARHHRTYRQANRRVPRAMRDVLSVLVGTAGPTRDRSVAVGEAVLGGPDFQELQDALFGRMLGARTLNLLNACFLILFITLILLTFATKETISWPSLLAYMVALRFTWSSVRIVTGLLTSFNQIFVEVERVATFMGESERQRLAEDRAPEAPALLVCTNPGRIVREWGTARQVALPQGSVVLAIDARVIDRYAIERSIAALGSLAGDPQALRPAVAHDQPRLVVGVSLSAHAFGSETPSAERMAALLAFVGRCGVGERIAELPGGIECVIGPEMALGRHVRYAVGIAYAALARPRTLALSAQPLVSAGEPMVETILAERTVGWTLIVDASSGCFDDSPAIAAAVTHVLVSLDRGETIVGDIEWFLRERPRIDAEIERLAKLRGIDTGPEEDEEIEAG